MSEPSELAREILAGCCDHVAADEHVERAALLIDDALTEARIEGAKESPDLMLRLTRSALEHYRDRAIRERNEARAEVERLRDRQEDHDLANEAIRWKTRALKAEVMLARVEKLAEKWEREENEHRLAGAFGVAEGLYVAQRDLEVALTGASGEGE